MKFKSKVDWFVHLSFAIMPITNIFLLVFFVISPSVVLGVCSGIFLITNILIIPWWLDMHYILDDNELIINLGGFWKSKRIAYSAITGVKETREPLSSAALPLDRIEIKFKAGKINSFTDVVYISPKDKQVFLSQLELHRSKDS